jgi:hypothetical protein
MIPIAGYDQLDIIEKLFFRTTHLCKDWYESSTKYINLCYFFQAVLASPLNGQFFVIGNPTEILGKYRITNISLES